MSEENENQYVVLARKYRPQTFEDLLGQDALVQTLTNAIKNNRLHHAYILTGIRGVGKTTTARLIARALNCTGLDGKGGPTITPCGACENCKAIAAGRHIDVMELDAASRTGVEDIRELLDGVRYKPVNARYKIYIIDEVHMLSKGAFNALLKTLEEPPAHVKFIFATTEIRKVPVTVLSRCQRFDLQRLSIETLMKLFHKITTAEGLEADEEALQIVARAADGSARDGLSLLDQAIVLGDGKIKTSTVADMIGLADRSQTLSLFESLVKGNMPSVVGNLKDQYNNGANPVSILQDLIHVTHMLTRAKIVPETIHQEMMSETERALCENLSKALSVGVLSRLWQILLKGLSEVNNAPQPLEALEMVLIRAAYASSLPTPSEILDDVKKNASPIAISKNMPAQEMLTAPEPAPKKITTPELPPKAPLAKASNAPKFDSVEDLIAYLEAHKQPILLFALKHDVSVTHFEDGLINLVVSDKTAPDFIQNLRRVLFEATQKNWVVEETLGQVGQTIADEEDKKAEENKHNVIQNPLIKAVLDEFKGAKIDTLTHKADTKQTKEDEYITPVYEEEDD